MILSTDTFTFELVHDRFDYNPDSADNATSYDKAYTLSEPVTSAHGVRLSDGTQMTGSIIVLAGGGASCIHAHSALLRSDALFIAVGPFVVRLSIPALNLVFSVETDEATCFGIHAIPGSSDIISHGELSITRVTNAGVILWTASGADIFTGDLIVSSNEVRIADFYERQYSFDLLTGACRQCEEHTRNAKAKHGCAANSASLRG